MSLREVIPSSFTDLLNLFGISLQSQKDNSFVLNGEVLPVVLVGSTTQIEAISTPLLQDVPFSAGRVAGPGAGAVLADSGVQQAGVYAFKVMVGQLLNSGNGTDWAIQRRDAANAANIWEQIATMYGSQPGYYETSGTLRLQVNERVRVIEITASALVTVQANLWLQRIGD